METMTESGGVIPHHHHHPIPGSGYFPQKDASPSSYFFPHNAPAGSQSSSVYRGYGGSSSSSSSEQTGDGVTGYGGQDRGHERRDSEERGGRAGSSDGRRSAGSNMMVPPPGGKSTGGGGSDRYHLPSSQYSTVTSSSSTTSATTSPYQQHPYHQHLRGMNPFLHQQQQQQQQQRIDEDKNKSAEGSRDSLLDPASRNDQTSSTSSSSSSPDKRSLAKDGGEISPKKGMLGANHPYDTNSMMSPFYYGGGSKGGRQQPGFMPDGRRSRGVYEKDTTMYMSDVRDSVKEVYDSFMQARGMNSGSGKDIAGKLPEAIPVAYDDNGDAQSDQQQLYREKLERSTSQDAAALATRNNGNNNNNNSMIMSPEYGGHHQMYDGNQQRPRAITMNSMYSRRDSPSSFQPSTSTPYRGNGTNGQDLYTKMREHFNRSEAALKNHYYFLDKEKEMEGRGGGGERGPVQPPPMSPTTSSSPYLGGKHQRRPSGDARSTSSHTQGIQEVSSRMMMMMSPSSAERYHHQSDHRQSYTAMHHYPHHQQKQLYLQQQQKGPVQTQHSPDAQQHYHNRSSMPSSQRPPNFLRKSLDGLCLDDQQGPQHSSSMKTPNRELRSPFESSSSARKSPITPGDSNLKKRWPSSSSTHGLASDKEDDQQRATRPNSTENGDDRESRNSKDSPSFYKDDKENRDDDKDMDGAGDGIGAKSLSPKGESEAIDDAQIADSLSRKLSSASLDTTSLPDALPRELLPPKKELMSDGEDDSFQNTPVTFRQMSSPSPSRSTSGIPSGYPTPFPHPADNHSPRHHHQQPPLAPQSLPPHSHHPHQQHHQQQQPQPPFFHSSPGRMPQPAFGSSRGFQDGGPPSGMPPAFPFNKDMPSRFPIPGLHHDMGPMGPSGSGFMGGPMSQMNVGGEKDVYFCHLCSYSGKSKPDFDNHMGIHFEYNCPHCDYTSRTEGRLKRHIKDFHTDENGRRSMPGRPKIFKCKQCSFSATEKDKFWEHARSHIKEDKLLQCPKCSFVTEYKHHLEYHLRNHFGSKPFKCNKCNYSCVNKSMLNSHMKSHTNVYQYRCSDCTYATKYCHSLKLHLKKYNHKPATVLNQDGSLPQGADVDASGLSVNTKRGPPRGPRGPRKEKGEPYFGQMFPGMPAMPMGIPPAMNPMLKGMMPFWPMVPPPPSGIPGHPGMMSGLPNMPPHMGGLRGRGDRDREDMRNGGEKGGMLDRSSESEMNGIMSGENSPSKEDDDVMCLPCKFCDFLADGTEALCLHLLQSHKDETGEMASMYGLSETALAESLERAKRLRMHKSDTRIERQMSEFSNDSELDMSEFKRRNTIAGLLSRDGSNFGRLSGDKAFWTASGFGPRDRRSLDDGRIQDLCYVDDGNDDGDNENETSGGMDILQQMTLKFGGGGNDGGVGVGNLHTERTKSVEVDMEDDHERENIQHGEHALLEDRKGHGHKESPLDLTKPKSLSPTSYSNPSSPRRLDEFNSEDDEVRPAWFDSEPRSELDKVTESLARKRQFSEAEDTNSLSAISGTGNVVATHPDSSTIVPRKRSRKGKAYKLETLCLKLQERHSLSPNDSDDPDNEMNDLEQYSFLSSESGDKDDVVGGNEKSREKEVEEKKSKVDSVEGDVDEVKQEEKTEDKNGIVFKTERQESECDKKEMEEGAEGQNIEMETGKKNIETENEKKDDVSNVKVEPLEDGDTSDEMKVKESGEGEESLKEGENSQMIKKESESDAAESSFEQLQEAIEDLSKGVTEEEREQENENVTEKGSALSDTPSDEHENREVNDNGDDNEDDLSLLNKISQIENENNTFINEDDDDAKTEILGEDLSSTRDDLFDLSDKENSNDGYECFENVGSPSSNKPASDEIQIEDKVDMINTVIENRKKPLPPAVRRGTELAWKLLNDPVNPVTSIPIPAVSPPPPPEWKNPSQPQLSQQPQRSSSPLMSPRAPNNMTSLPPSPTSHPHHHLVSGNNMSSPVKNGMRAPHPFHQIGLPPSPSINLNAMKPHFPIPLPPTPMAFIPPTNRMLPEHPLPRPPPPQITPPPTGPPSNNKPMPKDMYECTYCDLSFRDCVMYTVHMGYHSNRNPFKCNSCGIICRDKVEFFLHIARSPHS